MHLTQNAQSIIVQCTESLHWYVGLLKEVPGVSSQGETLEELEENIKDAYRLMIEYMPTVPHMASQSKEIEVSI